MPENYDQYSRADLLAEIEHHRDRAARVNGTIKEVCKALESAKVELDQTMRSLTVVNECLNMITLERDKLADKVKQLLHQNRK